MHSLFLTLNGLKVWLCTSTGCLSLICHGLKFFLCLLFSSLSALDFAKLYATTLSSLTISCTLSMPSLSPRYFAADSASIMGLAFVSLLNMSKNFENPEDSMGKKL